MNIGEYEDTIDTNDKQTRRSPQLINNKWKVITNCLQIIQQTLQFITGTTCTVFAIVLIITSCVLPNNSQRANVQKAALLPIGIGYLFIVKPILSTLSIILCCDIGFGSRSSMHNYKVVICGSMGRFIFTPPRINHQCVRLNYKHNTRVESVA